MFESKKCGSGLQIFSLPIKVSIKLDGLAGTGVQSFRHVSMCPPDWLSSSCSQPWSELSAGTDDGWHTEDQEGHMRTLKGVRPGQHIVSNADTKRGNNAFSVLCSWHST